MSSPSARELIETVLDPDSFVSWDTEPVTDAGERYAAQLVKAAERSGADEAVLTGEGLIDGRRVAVVLGEFGFLAGSMGTAASERVTLAFERATEQGLPMLASSASGGTRMQEGTPAFVQMVKMGQAVAAHRQAGLPYIVYLRHPTTGGVLASWASLGHICIAQPGALIGFLGPRVREVILGEPFPEGVQVAENLARRGVIDGVVPLEALRPLAIDVLRLLQAPQTPPSTPVDPPDLDALRAHEAWDSVQISRDPRRPGLRELLAHAADIVIPLRGTGGGESDLAVFAGLVRFPGWSCVLVGQDRRAQRRSSLGPAGLRVARRALTVAEELDLPVVTVVDTPGAELSTEAEHGGLAGEIARCLYDLAGLDVPVVSVILGEGSGGGALAFMPADRTLCAEHGWLAPLPPEGASAIVHRSGEHAADMARDHRIRSVDLLDAGVVDEIVAERPDAADEPEEFTRRIATATGVHVGELLAMPREERLAARRDRYRRLR